MPGSATQTCAHICRAAGRTDARALPTGEEEREQSIRPWHEWRWGLGWGLQSLGKADVLVLLKT